MAGHALSGVQALPTSTSRRRQAIAWAFTVFSTLRVLSYLPTLWAIHLSGDSSQHSLWTWSIWFGANLTMALWLLETQGHSARHAAAVSAFNAFMCLASFGLVAWYRLPGAGP